MGATLTFSNHATFSKIKLT